MRDLGQTECQKQETEHMYQNEQGKVNEYIRKLESLEEIISTPEWKYVAPTASGWCIKQSQQSREDSH